MIEIGESAKSRVWHVGRTLVDLEIPGIRLTRQQQTGHGHRWQGVLQALHLALFEPVGNERLHIIRQQTGVQCWRNGGIPQGRKDCGSLLQRLDPWIHGGGSAVQIRMCPTDVEMPL